MYVTALSQHLRRYMLLGRAVRTLKLDDCNFQAQTLVAKPNDTGDNFPSEKHVLDRF